MNQRTVTVIQGLSVGALLTAPAALFAVVSGGAGHGHYVFARLAFPYTMILTLWTGEITPPLMLLALLQFPLYGALYGACRVAKTRGGALMLLLVCHVAVAAVCFSGVIPNFS